VTQQKKLKTVRGSYTDLDLSIRDKKGPEKSRDTLPLKQPRLKIKINHRYNMHYSTVAFQIGSAL
jgi:hypothetical protein